MWSPDPTHQSTRLLKVPWTCGSMVRVTPFHGHVSSVCCSQAQRNRNVIPSFLRSIMPRPPSCLGRHTLYRETRHLLPCISSAASWKNALHPLSTLERAHFGASSTSRWWVGLAVTTVFTKTNLSSLVTKPFCQPGRKFKTSSIIGCQSERVNCLIDSWSPRYLQGKHSIWKGHCDRMFVPLLSTNHIEDFAKLTWRPEVVPKMLRVSLTKLMSDMVGLTKRTTSSTQIDDGCRGVHPGIALIATRCCAFTIIAVRTPMAITNRSGDSGSPWRNPRACMNLGHTAVDDNSRVVVVSKVAIFSHSRNLWRIKLWRERAKRWSQRHTRYPTWVTLLSPCSYAISSQLIGHELINHEWKLIGWSAQRQPRSHQFSIKFADVWNYHELIYV